MSNNIESDNFCPCCGRHCPADDLHCPRGREYFGMETDTSGRHDNAHHHGHSDTGMTIDDKVISLLLKCGHHLHHNTDRGNADISFLSEEEKHEFISLLKKCLKNWER